VTNLAIIGPQVVLTGSSVTYSAIATLSNGATNRNARPTTWNADNADVAIIRSAPDGIGELTGLGPGTATINAIHQGTSTTFSVRVRVMSEQKGGANLATSFMPKFNLSEADVKALAIFLKSRRGVNFAETEMDRYKAHVANVAVVIPPGTEGEKAGEQLIADRACTACHKLRDRDGGVAPDLSYEGLIRDRHWLMDHFKNPRSRIPDSIMPTFRFP